jgi:hypothetical protein
VFSTVHCAGEQLPEGEPLLGVECLEDVVLDVLLYSRGALERFASGGRDVDAVAPSIFPRSSGSLRRMTCFASRGSRTIELAA